MPARERGQVFAGPGAQRLLIDDVGGSPEALGYLAERAATDLEVVQDTREIEGGVVDCIIIRLVDSLNRNVFDLYTGPCGGRPESGTCDQPAVQSINGVMPDCDGNLTINFLGAQAIDFADGGGIALDVPLGMADVCTGQDYLPDSEGNLPSDYPGECPPPEPPEPPEAPPATGGLPPISSACSALPFYDSFDESPVSGGWVVTSGNFDLEAGDSPGEPAGLEQPESPPDGGGGGGGGGGRPMPSGFPGLPPLQRATQVPGAPEGPQGPQGGPGPPPIMVPIDQSFAATDQSRRNVAIWNCDYDSSNPSGITMTTHFMMMAGPQINAGVILAYVAGPTSPRADGRPCYASVLINPISGFIECGGYNGMQYGMALGWPFPVGGVPIVGDWYQLQVQYIPNWYVPPGQPNQAQAKWNVILTGVTDKKFPTFEMSNGSTLNTYTQGKCGLTTNNAHTLFSWYRLEILPDILPNSPGAPIVGPHR